MQWFQRACSIAGLAGCLTLFPAHAAETRGEPAVIETTTQEQLVGRIVREDATTVYFASDALGEVSLPRDKIKTLTHGARPAGGFTPAPAATPAASAAAAPGAAAAVTARSAWREWLDLPDSVTATISAGAGVKAGVVDQRNYTAGLTFSYTTPANIFNSALQYEYMKAGAVVAADDYYWDNLWQHNLGAKTFVLFGGRYRHDSVMAVQRELNVFAAPGLYLVKTDRFQFGVAGGLSWLYQDYGASAPGLADPAATRDLGVAAYQFLQYQVLPRVQITQNNLFTQSLDKSGKYIYRFLLSATLALTDHLSLVNMYGHGYDSEPAAGVDHGQDSLSTQLSYRF